MVRVYAEVEVEDEYDVRSVLNRVPGQVQKAVLLVWFDADERPQQTELRLFEYWDVSDGSPSVDAGP